MPVDCRDALVGALLKQLGCDNLLRRQHDAVLAADADRGAAILNRLYGIFDLEVAAIGGENGVGKIVACSYGSLLLPKGDNFGQFRFICWRSMTLLSCAWLRFGQPANEGTSAGVALQKDVPLWLECEVVNMRFRGLFVFPGFKRTKRFSLQWLGLEGGLF